MTPCNGLAYINILPEVKWPRLSCDQCKLSALNADDENGCHGWDWERVKGEAE